MERAKPRWGLVYLILTVILLAIAFLNFSPNVGSAIEIIMNISPQSSANFAEMRASPAIIKIKVRVLAADMGLSREFMGNETDYDLKPVRGALVLVVDEAAAITGSFYIPEGDYLGFTNSDGEVILSAPKGNFTLMINPRPYSSFMTKPRPYNPDPKCFWRSLVNADENKTIEVRFHLYRLNPIRINVSVSGARPETRVELAFKLPYEGSYHIGAPVITYYNNFGEIRLYRYDLGGSSTFAEEFWAQPRINYLLNRTGGMEIAETIRINEILTYISPSMTYLPVERVVLKEVNDFDQAIA